MKRSRRRFVLVLVLLACATAVAYRFRDRFRPMPAPPHQTTTAETPRADAPKAPGGPDGREPHSKPANDNRAAPPTTRPAQPAPPVPRAGEGISPADRAKAMNLLRRGLASKAQGRVLDARAAIADALNTGALPAENARRAREELSALANETLFSRRVTENDPCAFTYRFNYGDVMVQVDRKLKLRVPSQLILRINDIPDATKIQAGQTLKMIRGPFHAVVSKSRFTMDVFLEEPDTHRMIFVRRFSIGVGKDDSTPIGRWRIVLGGKIPQAPWTPPASSDMERKKILWGEPGYPLGEKGYWISLEGIEGTPYTRHDGYGIHGTNDPSSIGRASSLGCIRLSDKDIEMVFSLLYEKWSTVTVLP